MTNRSLLVVVAILLFASPAFSQFGQGYNRLTDSPRVYRVKRTNSHRKTTVVT